MEYSEGSGAVGKSRMDSRKIRDPPMARRAPAVRIESSTSLWGGPQRSSRPLTSPRFSFYTLRRSLSLIFSPSRSRANSPFQFLSFLSFSRSCPSADRDLAGPVDCTEWPDRRSSASLDSLRRPPIFREGLSIPRNDDLYNSVSLRPSGSSSLPIPGLTRDPLDIQDPTPDRFHRLDFCILFYSLCGYRVDKFKPDPR